MIITRYIKQGNISGCHGGEIGIDFILASSVPLFFFISFYLFIRANVFNLPAVTIYFTSF